MSAPVDVLPPGYGADYDTREGMEFRVRRQLDMARDWQRRLLAALRNDESADCHPEPARWQRNAYIKRARRIRAEFEASLQEDSHV